MPEGVSGCFCIGWCRVFEMFAKCYTTRYMRLLLTSVILVALLGVGVFLPFAAVGQTGTGCQYECAIHPVLWRDSGFCSCVGGSSQGSQNQVLTCHYPCPGTCDVCPDGTEKTRTIPCRCPLLFENPIKHNSLEELIFAVINGVTILLMPIIVLSVAYMGFRMVLAGSERNADYTKWKKAFGWSLVGIFLVLGARGILFVIQNTVNELLDDEYRIGDQPPPN